MELSEIKKNMNKTVLYDGGEYILKACRLFLDHARPEFKYSAELVSKKTNTLISVPIASVKIKAHNHKANIPLEERQFYYNDEVRKIKELPLTDKEYEQAVKAAADKWRV